MPTAPFGNDDVETETGEGLTVSERLEGEERFVESVTVMVAENGPVREVVPLMTPVAEIDNPGLPGPIAGRAGRTVEKDRWSRHDDHGPDHHSEKTEDNEARHLHRRRCGEDDDGTGAEAR